MLPRQERLTRAGLFTRAYNGRKSVSNALFTLYVVPKTNNRPGQKPAVGSSTITKENERKSGSSRPLDKMPVVRMPLAGFVIAKKVSKSACKRNRAKRRIREAYRLIRHDRCQHEPAAQNLEQWYALVFVLHEKCLSASWEEVRDSVASVLTKAAAKFGQQR